MLFCYCHGRLIELPSFSHGFFSFWSRFSKTWIYTKRCTFASPAGGQGVHRSSSFHSARYLSGKGGGEGGRGRGKKEEEEQEEEDEEEEDEEGAAKEEDEAGEGRIR